ncbi:L-histidine N(alpha)-methyltransferase [Parvularcula sp. LCG005]|uniref:L-histidine N(alpha)-methyltransferase n=1 Tax=Parvularcula sp. LCG005 TaxID=3078805 RepID=UPI00294301D8|nr:L-histidine N(alpha)-methyltransferase [Parvularcula sp. LCG005]WOI52708.1 L-histidine N(alpha)-methyltransferase [Parvularcula sp. LCG005]
MTYQTRLPENPFLADVLTGLNEPQKSLPCRWLYDKRGSHLFEEITELPEYYPTRTERSILTACASAVADHVGPGAVMVEYGAGSSIKTRLILDALSDPSLYVPIDVSSAYLDDTARQFEADYETLQVTPVVGDFLSPVDLPRGEGAGRRVGFFPGSTVGNLSDDEIDRFLRHARRTLGDNGMLLIGVDLRKSEDVLVPAYDDEQGVTAAFNLNILRRINRELDADFDLEAFQHEARWNDEKSRIEMHLVSVKDQDVHLADQTIHFTKGETIHTENSRKFSLDQISAMAARTGWRVADSWTDAKDYFSVQLFEAV